MSDRNYLGHWATATAEDAAVNGLTLVGGKALTRTATPILGSAGKALSVMPHPVARITGRALTAGSKLGPLLADWGSFGIKAAPIFAALDTYGQYRADKDEAKWYKDHPYTYISDTNPNINYGAATAAGLVGLFGAGSLPIFKKNRVLRTLFKALAATGLGYAGYKMADRWQRSQTKQASSIKGQPMDITTIYSSMRKRAGLFDNLGQGWAAYNHAKMEADPGYMLGQWIGGKVGQGAQKAPASTIDISKNSVPVSHYANRSTQAQQPQAPQPIQQPAGNALPQDAKMSGVEKENEAIMNMYKQTLNTIKSNNAAAGVGGNQQAATSQAPNYMSAVGFNNQK